MNTELKLARYSKNLTQQEVADMVGIDRSTYARYETGTLPPYHRAIKISKVLNAEIHTLFNYQKKLINSEAIRKIMGEQEQQKERWWKRLLSRMKR